MDEDMILPDDFESLPANESMTDTQEPVEDFDTDTVEDPTSEPAEPVEAKQEPTEPQKIKIKVDREEREVSVEEAAILAQKGMNYERAIERARQEAAQQAKDDLIASENIVWNGKKVSTYAEYQDMLQERAIINKYKDADLPDEVIKELMESRRDREERQKEKAARDEEAKTQQMWHEFFRYFEEVNERAFDTKKDSLPTEVEEAVKKGQSPLSAYMKHHSKELRNQLKIAKQNQANTKKAPVGSVTAGGGIKSEPEDLFLKGFNSI